MQRLLRIPRLLSLGNQLHRTNLRPASLQIAQILPTAHTTPRYVSSTSPTNANPNPKELREAWGQPNFDINEMKHALDHDNHEMRDSCRQFLSGDLMKPKYNISIDEERDMALKRLQAMCDNNYISVLDFRDNPLRIFAAHELSAIVDPAMTTKMTVQFNLFGGTVLKLGTERHHDKLLPGNECRQ